MVVCKLYDDIYSGLLLRINKTTNIDTMIEKIKQEEIAEGLIILDDLLNQGNTDKRWIVCYFNGTNFKSVRHFHKPSRTIKRISTAFYSANFELIKNNKVIDRVNKFLIKSKIIL